MVTNINDNQKIGQDDKKGGLIVELVGLAGTGKSTLTRNLKKNVPWIIEVSSPRVWNFRNASFYTNNILSLVPTYLHIMLEDGGLIKRREIAFMALLNGWQDVLIKKKKNSSNVFIIDQGPISIMAYLQMWSTHHSLKDYSDSWWLKVYEHWTDTLDVVIWLDAPYETLIKRIRNRKQAHRLKEKSDQYAQISLMRYYMIYERIINALSNNNPNLEILRIDSGKNSVDEIVNIVTSDLESRKPFLNLPQN